MKKTFFAALAALAMSAGLVSCSSDEPVNGSQNGQEVAVTVTATLPSNIQSRAFSDGEKALDMYYAVYEEGVTEPIISLTKHTQQFSGLQNSLTLHLVTGKTYNVVFWAQSPNAGDYFTLDTDNSTVTVNYDKIKNLNVEDVDAFFTHKSVEVKGAATITAELKRPFAQINVGTSDINEAGLKSKQISATMTVGSVYSQFDLKSGDVIGNTSSVDFKETLRPNQGKETTDADYEQFPVGNLGQYEYLAMAYVLMSPDKITTDVDLTFYDNGTKFHELSVPGAPVQRNYRTNIFGALLTSDIDFTITINPDYDGDHIPNEFEVTPSNLVSTLQSVTEDAILYLSEGKYTLATGAGGTVQSTFKWSSNWDDIVLEHEAMDCAPTYSNLKEGITITLVGDGTDKTAILMSDGQYGVPAGSINGSIRVNGANIVLKNMLVVQRGYTICDATDLTYDGCEIWGTVMAHSETVNFKNCSFWYVERTKTDLGLSIQANQERPLMYNNYARYINFDNCEFHASQNKALQFYAAERRYVIQDITAKNCTLYGGDYKTKLTADDSWRSFFELHTDDNYYLHGTLTLTDCKIDSAYESYWPGGVWAMNKTYNNFFTVVVDGTQVNTADYTEGKDNPWNNKLWK